MLEDIKTELSRLTTGQISWGGRMNIFKMVILPKIMYKIQMLPIALPQKYFKTLQTILLNFVWQGKKACISWATLKKNKTQGGWGAPDIRGYYEAVILTRVIDWIRDTKQKRWVSMEFQMSNALLGSIIWIPDKYRELGRQSHSITRHAIKIWDRVHKREKWDFNSPLMPIKDSNYFTPGLEKISGKWIKKKMLS